MGQKINPVLARLTTTRGWDASWFARGRELPRFIAGDYAIRKYISKEYKEADIDRIKIERMPGKVSVLILCGRPGTIIGRAGDSIDKLKKELAAIVPGRYDVTVREVRAPELSARIMAKNVCDMLEKRSTYRRAGKMTLEKIMQKGARGAKIRIAGRLGGADISRAEVFKDGDVPLQTLRADIDYAHAEAWTPYGILGVKVWINRGEQFAESQTNQ